MDRQQGEPIAHYRQRLLDSLEEQPHRRDEIVSASLQVFVNHDCVGALHCRHVNPSFAFTSRERSIQCVELRNEAGVLVGGLFAPELGLRTTSLDWAGHRIDLTIQNRLDGGSLRVVLEAVPSFWSALGRSVARLSAGWREPSLRPAVGRGWALAQVGVLVAVGFLVADRWMERPDPSKESVMGRDIVATALTHDAISRLEAKLDQVSAAQVVSSQALAGQHKVLAGVQRTVEDLTQQQKQMGTQMVSVQHMEEHQERIASRASVEVERMAHVLMGQVQSERAQLREELHSLSMANEHLAKYVSAMERKNQDLMARMRAAGIEVSAKSTDGAGASQMLAQHIEPGTKEHPTGPASTHVADARTEGAPLHFFVSFQEGTPEESIDRWFQDIHARKGDADSGWYSVEVPRPALQPAERFMEGLKRVNIVKAVETSKTRRLAR